ncbi:unnamed protein product [Cuscuta epithymum]|uniref:Protein phosphatase n=1 Tax=Cuscuta epithymum TaxID=186058 RepID=A0AAV0D457_9ASTE|nr:unnamed protein product [Cuscuta epithymum]
MAATSLYIPKENPKRPLGEDAHFTLVQQGRSTFGVADGVGGWAAKGIDAGKFARELMINVTEVLELAPPTTSVNPKRVLEKAFKKTSSAGTSTACIVTHAAGTDTLKAVNVGDSGFYVIRGGKVVYRSPVQQRKFNYPYQLGKDVGDGPSVAQELEVKVEKGDWVVAGTDGLLDNVDVAEIEEAVDETYAMGGGSHMAESLTLLLGNIALNNSYDRKKETPFSRAARLAGLNYSGGKIDDITVVVAYIS